MINDTNFFGTEKIWKILSKLAPPVMFAQLIQALYNIVDSFYIGRCSEAGLTALSIIYPVQLLITAIGVGTGVGVNTVMARYFGMRREKDADEIAGVGTIVITLWWLIVSVFIYFFMPFYARISTDSSEVISYIITYGRIIGVFSLGIFLESIWTKVHQASGNMRTPMIAQIVGAVINMVLDPMLIFGYLGFPAMGIKGAAIATIIGQIAAAVITGRKGFRRPPAIDKFKRYICDIYKAGIPSILMQSAYTFYILGLNLILAGFSDQAVTTLGLYYKWQTFFFIPLGGLQTCIVPIISYNYAIGDKERCKSILWNSCLFGAIFMMLGVICFDGFPVTLLRVFSKDDQVVEIGRWAFRWIGISFIPMVTSLIFPVFFQALGKGIKSMVLTVVRTVVLFVPLGWILAKISLNAFWFTFPITEVVTSIVGLIFYRQLLSENGWGTKGKDMVIDK